MEGMIMERGTTIKLSRTVSMDSRHSSQDIFDSRVYVIDDGNNVVAVAEPQISEGMTSSVYIVNGEITFVPGMKYALDIHIGEKHYQSAFVAPVLTPEIDSISWRKNTNGSMDIMVSTHDPEHQVEYYRWTFEEDWEYKSWYFGEIRYEISGALIPQSLFTENNRFYCWDSNKSKSIILGTSERLTEKAIKDRIIHNFQSDNTRFSYLYSILVKQYGIDREAYMYFANLQKNIESSGSLFAPILTELKGNITCLSDPEEPVVGYIAATIEVVSRVFINMERIGGEDDYKCESTRRYESYQLADMYAAGYGIFYLQIPGGYYVCAPVRCIDCTMRGGTKNKPDFWPTDHQ